jgi:hypothetical protein
MIKNLRRYLYWLGLIIGGLLFVNQLIRGYTSIRLAEIELILMWGVVLGILLAGLTHLLRTLAWIQIMKTIGIGLPLRETVQGYTLSFISRYIPGSIWGYLSRSEWLFQRFQLPYRMTVLGSFLESLMSFMTAIMVIGWTMALGQTLSMHFLLVLMMLVLPFIVWFVLTRATSWPILRKYFGEQFSTHKAMRSNLGSWILACSLYLLIWLSFGIILFYLVRAFGLSTPGGIRMTTMVFTIAWTAGFLVLFIPTGLGIRELILSNLILLFVGTSYATGSAVAVLIRFLAIVGELLWILIVLFAKNQAIHRKTS